MIFAGAGVLLLVAIVLYNPFWDYSELEPTQMAKDVRLSRDALIDIFEPIERFFRRLEEYAEVPMTEAMKYIMVKIMAEVLGIFAIATSEIGQREASGLTFYAMLSIANTDSEIFSMKLIGRRDIDDALSRLDGLTQEARMATAQVLKVADGVEVVSEDIEDVGDKVNRLIEGTFSTLAPYNAILNPHAISWQGNESSHG